MPTCTHSVDTKLHPRASMSLPYWTQALILSFPFERTPKAHDSLYRDLQETLISTACSLLQCATDSCCQYSCIDIIPHRSVEVTRLWRMPTSRCLPYSFCFLTLLLRSELPLRCADSPEAPCLRHLGQHGDSQVFFLYGIDC